MSASTRLTLTVALASLIVPVTMIENRSVLRSAGGDGCDGVRAEAQDDVVRGECAAGDRSRDAVSAGGGSAYGVDGNGCGRVVHGACHGDRRTGRQGRPRHDAEAAD